MGHNMNIFYTPLSENHPYSYYRDKIKLEREIKTYISHVKVAESWFHFNRIFISPGNSFNVKHIVKFLSSKLAQPNGIPGTRAPSTESSNNDRLIPQKIIGSQSSTTLNNIEVVKDKELVVNEEDYVFEILDRLSPTEFSELLDIEPVKRLETLKIQYRMINDIFDDKSIDNLDKLNSEILTEVPYELYIEDAEHNNIPQTIEAEQNHFVNKVKNGDLLRILKTCGVIVIDISRGIGALSRGKEIFRSFKKEIAYKIKGKGNINATKNKRLIILLSTVMTWAGVHNNCTVSKNYNMKNRVPNPAFSEHYKFELEVLAVNQTIGLKEIVSTIIIWSGFTYGYEQDLLRYAFNSACRNTDVFPIPKSQNQVPVIHITNLARLIHKVISEKNELLKYNNCIFAVESPMYTLKQIITTLGKTCDVRTSTSVSLDTFINNHKLKGLHKQMMSVDMKVNWNIKQVWPKWYGGKSSIILSMKSLVETYIREHNIKILKLHILAPVTSDSTTLAHQIAKYYNLIYLDPMQITQKHINEIREEIVSLRLITTPEIDSIDDFDDDDHATKVNPLLIAEVLELDKKLETLYSSIDSNGGVLEDKYLIPLLNQELSHLAFTRRGYVLNGYPNTAGQAEDLFGDANSSQKIDTNKLPDLVVFVKHNTQRDLNMARSNNIIELETKERKKKIGFAELIDVYQSSSGDEFGQSLASEVVTKSALKKPMTNDYINGAAGKLNYWDEENYENLVKMFNRNYVPIKTVNFSVSSLDLNKNQLKSTENNVDSEQIFNAIIKEIELNQLPELFKDNMVYLNKNYSINNGIDVERSQFEHLKEKMTLLEEFGHFLDFERIESLSREEYLIKHVTPNLSKLLVQVAKTKPKNAVGFLAHMALKEYPESLLHCPGYYEESVQIQKRLEYMYNIFDPDNAVNSNSLVENMSMICSSSDEDVNENEEESLSQENTFKNHTTSYE